MLSLFSLVELSKHLNVILQVGSTFFGAKLKKGRVTTTGFRRFAECLMHSAKATLPSAKPLPRAALGKEHPVKNPSAKSLPSAISALGKEK